MRILLVLLLAGLLVVVPVQGQESPAEVLQDAADDVRTEVQGQAGPNTPLYPAVDLLGLTLQETASDIQFVLKVADLKPSSEDTGLDGTTHEIFFTHNGREFRLTFYRGFPAIQDFTYAILAMRDRVQDEWSEIWGDFFGVQTDLEANTFALAVNREVLSDADGSPPFRGRALENISAHARSQLSDGDLNFALASQEFPTKVLDDMPAAGAPKASFPLQFGAVQTGHARLWSEAPFRASNGEATTYVILVEAQNIREEVDDFELVASGVPSHITVVLPVPYLTLEGEESFEVPILVTVPFGHDHGSSTTFTLEMRSQSDPTTVGRIELGVRFLAVPQPAGHHSTLFLHAPAGQSGALFFDFNQGRMNTLEVDTTAGPGPYYSTGLSSGSGGFRHDWEYMLTPALELGLDVDLTRTGAFSIPITTVLPLQQATLEGDLWLFGYDSYHIGTLMPTAPVDTAPQSTTLFTGEFVPSEEADEIPFMPGNNLYLSLSMNTQTPGLLGQADEGPGIVNGAWLELPLLEWHDEVNTALAALDGPNLRALGEQERRVNPGEAVLFEARVTNPLDEGRTIRFAASGPNAAWATFPSSVRVPAGESANITVVIRAPADALHGDRADIVLQAFTKDEPNARGLLRLVAQVDTEQDLPDEAAAAPAINGKQSPPFTAGLLVLALALLALRRRST